MTRFPFLIHTHHHEVAIPSYCRRGSHNIILQQCQNHFHRWVRVHLSSVPRLAVFWTKKMNVNLTEMWLQKKTMSLPFLTHCLVLLCAETLQYRSCYCPFLSSVRKKDNDLQMWLWNEEDVNSRSPQRCGAFSGRKGTNFSHSLNDVWASERTLTTAKSVMFCRQLALRAGRAGRGGGGEGGGHGCRHNSLWY